MSDLQSTLPGQALAIRSGKSTAVFDAEVCFQSVLALPAEKRVQAVSDVNGRIDLELEGVYSGTQQWNKYLKSKELVVPTCHQTRLEEEQEKAQNLLDHITKLIQTKNNEREKMAKKLEADGERGVLFAQHLRAISLRGLRFYAELNTLFTIDPSARHLVLRLNHACLQKLRVSTEYDRIFFDYDFTIVRNAKNAAKAVKGNWTIEEGMYSSHELGKLGLRFNAFGLLVRSESNDKVIFPEFAGEDSHPTVVVYSNSETFTHGPEVGELPASGPATADRKIAEENSMIETSEIASSTVASSAASTLPRTPPPSAQPVARTPVTSSKDVSSKCTPLEIAGSPVASSAASTFPRTPPLSARPVARTPVTSSKDVSSKCTPLEIAGSPVASSAASTFPRTPLLSARPVARIPVTPSKDLRSSTNLFFSKRARSGGSSTSNNVSPKKVVGMNCCSLTREWKTTIDSWETASREKKFDVLKAMKQYCLDEEELCEIPCEHHLSALESALYMIHVRDVHRRVANFAKIHDVVGETQSYRRPWVHPSTAHLFDWDNAEIREYRAHKIITDKYVATRNREFKLELPSSRSKEVSKTVHHTKNALGWIVHDKDLMNILREELEMHRFHCREYGQGTFAVLINMYHSIIMQIVRMDPQRWIEHVGFRNDKEIRLITIPTPACFIRKGHYSNHGLDNDAIVEKFPNVLYDEVVLTGSAVLTTYYPLVNKRRGLKYATEIFQRDRKRKVEKDWGFLTFPQISTAFKTGIIREFESEPVDVISEAGDVTTYPLGSIISRTFDIAEDRFFFAVGYIAVDKNGICENGVRAKNYAVAHKKLRAPRDSRFGIGSKDDAFNPEVSVRIRGLGPLSDSLVGAEDMDNGEVLIEKEEWLNKAEADKMKYSAWKRNAKEKAKEAFGRLKELEKRTYAGNTSYFTWKGLSESDRPAVPDAASEIIEVSSDEENEKKEYLYLSSTPSKRSLAAQPSSSIPSPSKRIRTNEEETPYQDPEILALMQQAIDLVDKY